MDRNCSRYHNRLPSIPSLSARRAWIEIQSLELFSALCLVALRKESVDRNVIVVHDLIKCTGVALRKESVDRNSTYPGSWLLVPVALRKESVDRNRGGDTHANRYYVALRKESVDRNIGAS